MTLRFTPQRPRKENHMKTMTARLAAAITTAGVLVVALLFFAGPASAAPSGTCTGYPGCTTSPSGGGPTVSGSGKAGSEIVIHGQGCSPGAKVTAYFDGTTYIGSDTVTASGRYTIHGKLPSDATPGPHTIKVEGAGCSGVAGIEVTASGGGAGNNGNSGGLAGTGVAVVGIGALGAVLLAGGGLMLLAGRRRGNHA
jgi:hypothetical protein